MSILVTGNTLLSNSLRGHAWILHLRFLTLRFLEPLGVVTADYSENASGTDPSLIYTI